MPEPETSFTSRIEQLQSENLKLTTDLDAAHRLTMKEIGLKDMATAEAARLKAIVQAAVMDKQTLQQEVQKLQSMLDFLRHTTSKTVNEFLKQLKLDLNLPACE